MRFTFVVEDVLGKFKVISYLEKYDYNKAEWACVARIRCTEDSYPSLSNIKNRLMQQVKLTKQDSLKILGRKR